MNTSLSKILILCAAVLWGTTGTAQALASAEAHSVAIGAVRLAVGGLSLFAALSYSKKESGRKAPSYSASCGCCSKYGRLSAFIFFSCY